MCAALGGAPRLNLKSFDVACMQQATLRECQFHLFWKSQISRLVEVSLDGQMARGNRPGERVGANGEIRFLEPMFLT